MRFGKPDKVNSTWILIVRRLHFRASLQNIRCGCNNAENYFRRRLAFYARGTLYLASVFRGCAAVEHLRALYDYFSLYLGGVRH